MTASEVSIKGYSEPGDGSRPLPEASKGVSGNGKCNLGGGYFYFSFFFPFFVCWWSAIWASFFIHLAMIFVVSDSKLFYSL